MKIELIRLNKTNKLQMNKLQINWLFHVLDMYIMNDNV